MTPAACLAARGVVWGLVVLAGVGASARADPPPAPQVPPAADGGRGAGAPRAERLWHHRNLGKAFFENPTTQYEAVEELKKALELAPDSARDRLNYGLALLKAGKTAEGMAELETVAKQDPTLPHPWFNLGIALKRESKYDEAIAKLETMAKLVPDEPVTRFNLGALYKLTGKPERSLAEFEAAARLAPSLAGPHFQLYNAYKAAGRAEDAARELALFRERKAAGEGAAVPEDLEWSFWSELADEPAPGEPAAASVEPVWKEAPLATGIDAGSARLAVLDADGDGRPDLLVSSSAGVLLFKGGTQKVAATGLEDLKGVRDVAPGDLDDDGLADLAVVSTSGVSLLRNAGGRFERFAAALPSLPAGAFSRALWLDVDHDYDVDLVLLGERATVLRNPGAGASDGWVERADAIPFVAGSALAGVALHAVSDAQGSDLAVAYADRPGVLYRDRLGGRYEAEPMPALAAGTKELAALDENGDGWIDLVAGAAGSALVLLNERGKGFAAAASGSAPSSSAARGLPLDADGSGRLRQLARPDAAQLAAADFDGDGRIDLTEVTAAGALRRLDNATPNPPGVARSALALRLEGVKNPKLAPGAEVEVKAGAGYSKQTYRGVPLLFGLGGRSAIDTVRITWPNGLIQNETALAPRPLGAPGAPLETETAKEAPRLSGSCPMVFTWNGERFEFLTDVLGVAPLGASAGDGATFPVDHDEHVKIPPGALVEVDGRYELRITEELREVTYLDQVRLFAVDRPAEVEVLTNDRFQDPPFPPLALHGLGARRRPIAARDDAGRDVLPALAAIDRRYPDGFDRDASGVAAPHALEVDFGPDPALAEGAALLVLTGWVDWADGSTFLASAQRPGGALALPRLLVRDGAGRWVTAIESLPIPAGKPKSIVVDLAGKWASAAREIRIETNLCVYWDEIALAAPRDLAALGARATWLDPDVATLRYRGFSRPVIDPARKQPEGFDYQSFQPVAMWNPTPGLYTRYGDVRELLEGIDDRFVVFGSGDEIRLSFPAAALPPLPSGFARDLFLKVDGWAKDGDANTAFSQSVLPLPFHGMSGYPYLASEAYPSDAVHELYQRTHNTRPALRLIPPLRPPAPRTEAP